MSLTKKLVVQILLKTEEQHNEPLPVGDGITLDLKRRVPQSLVGSSSIGKGILT
ncbi:MAG: hypothetical protein QG577_519, partial [Thermodesulfobacteriota bacterium]|nr:hypothetical protein [Thermodesulfobacteriota bacterium]